MLGVTVSQVRAVQRRWQPPHLLKVGLLQCAPPAAFPLLLLSRAGEVPAAICGLLAAAHTPACSLRLWWLALCPLSPVGCCSRVLRRRQGPQLDRTQRQPARCPGFAPAGSGPSAEGGVSPLLHHRHLAQRSTRPQAWACEQRSSAACAGPEGAGRGAAAAACRSCRASLLPAHSELQAGCFSTALLSACLARYTYSHGLCPRTAELSPRKKCFASAALQTANPPAGLSSVYCT